jgi:hypothetical protein
MKTWAVVLEQFEGMFLTAIAVGRLLNIEKPVRITCYVAGTEDHVMSPSQTSPILFKPLVGRAKTLGHWESWENEVVKLPLSFTAELVKGWQNPDGITSFGQF